MAPNRVTITYTAPPTFLSTDHWKQVHAALLSQLPLRNLHWKSASRPSIHTIQELPVNLVPADTVRDEHTSQVPQTLLERPLLNAYIVVCEVRLYVSGRCSRIRTPPPGRRDIQEHCKEADQGLAHADIAEEEPGMAHRPHRPTRQQDNREQNIPDESVRTG